MERHHTLLDGFPELVQTLRRVCSGEVALYMTEEVRLDYSQFLDVLHMLAHDGADPVGVSNPPARIRTALSRQERRQLSLERERWMPATAEQVNNLACSQNLESRIVAEVDWDRAKRDLCLPPDQVRAVEARIDGCNLQASEVPGDLDWDSARVEKVRRSLEPDRRWGRSLRQRLSAYAADRNRGKKSKKKCPEN